LSALPGRNFDVASCRAEIRVSQISPSKKEVNAGEVEGESEERGGGVHAQEVDVVRSGSEVNLTHSLKAVEVLKMNKLSKGCVTNTGNFNVLT
jgi:hypothetical protein